MWKKWGSLTLASLLVLTGCSNQAAIVRDSVVKSLDTHSYDFKGTFKLTGDFAKAYELSEGKKPEAEWNAVFESIKSGVTIEGTQTDFDRGRYVITANDDKVLREKGLWSKEEKASAEFLIDKTKTYITTPHDSKYLLIDEDTYLMEPEYDDYYYDEEFDATKEEELTEEEKAAAAVVVANAPKIAELEKQLNDMMIDFMKKYIKNYEFTLSKVTNHGETTVELPNGQSVKATHVTINLDTKEMIRILVYTMRDAVSNPEVRKFAVDAFVLSEQISDLSTEDFTYEEDGNTYEVKDRTPAELRADAEERVSYMIDSLKESLAGSENFDAATLEAEVKEAGLEAFNMQLDYYVAADKTPVRTGINLSLTVQDNEADKPEPLTFGLEADTYQWNFGKPSAVNYPAEDKTVDMMKITEDKTLVKDFDEKGFLGYLLREAIKEQSFIVFDLNTKTTTLNDEKVANIHPYQATGGTVMVPFRFIGESMGAKISYNAATKTATFEKGAKKVELVTGSKNAKVDGKTVQLPFPATNVKGSLYVPLRFVSENLGADVTWIGEDKQAIIQFDVTE
ncbi:copper amine oxidase N-terminal domain-containing protein [Brevibacillus dissolubilis]|uniref:copper amine oxidase N-terminal domain-containing protein n=1 Tax=Brevibacillus dissolubilis TaxID=1844116 RepID=UPI00159BBF07|nr:copper amine oxidase N-terminal domain-containing protein [Brevibacillus dissolubilis]